MRKVDGDDAMLILMVAALILVPTLGIISPMVGFFLEGTESELAEVAGVYWIFTFIALLFAFADAGPPAFVLWLTVCFIYNCFFFKTLWRIIF